MAQDKRFTAKQVKKKLRRIANETGPEYIYVAPSYEDEYGEMVEAQECYYTDGEGKPSCIIGQLLARDLPGVLRVLHVAEWKHDDLMYHGPKVFSVTDLVGNEALPYSTQVVDLTQFYTEDAIKLMAYAQNLQDNGKPWGQVAEAIAKR